MLGTMSISAGTRLAHYEVLGPLGAGGMGEVYRALDTTLKREVAIKLLPEKFANDPSRLARFEREAQLLASLNHTNIGAIYGLERAEIQPGSHTVFLVLELIEGPTLTDRLASTPRGIFKQLPSPLAIRLQSFLAEWACPPPGVRQESASRLRAPFQGPVPGFRPRCKLPQAQGRRLKNQADRRRTGPLQ